MSELDPNYHYIGVASDSLDAMEALWHSVMNAGWEVSREVRPVPEGDGYSMVLKKRKDKAE